MIRRTTYACRVHSSSSSTMGSSPSYYAQGKGGRVNRAGGDGIGRKINPAGRAEIYEHQSPKYELCTAYYQSLVGMTKKKINKTGKK